MPQIQTSGVPNIPRSMPVVRSFADGTAPIFEERNYTITGVTKNSSGAALGSVTVKLFNQATDILVASTISDASGNYSFIVDKTQLYYEVAYLAGSPDVAGTTVNTLAGS